VTAKEKWRLRKKKKKRVYLDAETGATYELGNRYFTDSSAEPYLELISKLRERAERGTKHPDALAAESSLKANGNPRTRRRDGSFAPPEWPVGGGGFHVAKRDQAAAEAAVPAVVAPEVPVRSQMPDQRREANCNGAGSGGTNAPAALEAAVIKSLRTGSSNIEISGEPAEKRRMSKAERKKSKKAA